MSEISKDALAAACEEKIKQLEFSVKQSAFDSVRQELETELAIARVALLALRDRAEPEFYGPYTPVMMGAGVWVSIADELPPHLEGRKVWVTTSQPISPPAPVVPDALPEHDSYDGNDIDYMEPSAVYELGKTHGWNACRAAMLQPVSRPYKLQVSPQDESKPTKN